MNIKKRLLTLALMPLMTLTAFTDELPVSVSSNVTELASNGLYRKIRTVFTFVNPNPRQISWDLEFPLPEGATVCGYALEINGAMIPGSVVPKEEARVAFENEKKVRVDPGLVEQAYGNVWRTRIFPLNPKTPRKAQVDYIEPIVEGPETTLIEQDGNEFFIGMRTNNPQKPDVVPGPFAELVAALKQILDEDVTEPLEEKVERPARRVWTRKVKKGETLTEGMSVQKGDLLATAWAAEYIADYAGEAESRKAEFIELGKKYGIASAVTSLLVLENLGQYLKYHVEPAQSLPFHDEWIRRSKTFDEGIRQAQEQASHRSRLLHYWQERLNWWNDPIPQRRTPRSGLFGRVHSAPSAAEMSDHQTRDIVTTGLAPFRSGALDDEDSDHVLVAASAMPRNKKFSRSDSVRERANPSPSTKATVTLTRWNPDQPYLKELAEAKVPREVYRSLRAANAMSPAFFLDVGGWFFEKGDKAQGAAVLIGALKVRPDDAALWRSAGWRYREAGLVSAAVVCFRCALKLRPEEAQSHRDLALALWEEGANLNEAAHEFCKAALQDYPRRSARRGNDFQAAVMALEEVNALLATHPDMTCDELPAEFRRDMPCDLRITLSWSVDETDIDIHVLEPDGEEAYYGNRRTAEGGFVGEDVTTGYGPEEYLAKRAQKGTYQVKTNYFASHQTDLVGATSVTVTIYTNWGRPDQKMQIQTHRLSNPRHNATVGSVSF